MLKRPALFTLLFAASLALAWGSDEVRSEFHQTYPLAADGRVAVSNVNGAIQVSAWDRNEVKVDAVKRGHSQQDLDDARIVVDAKPGSVDIRTKYPEHDHNRHAASVDYTITVPRGAALDHIDSVNGSVVIDGVAGSVRANSVNGKVEVRRAQGDVDASTVNGRVEAAFDRLSARHISLKTVNGGILLGLPKDASARLKASTVHGDISSDFDLTVRHAGFGPGSSLETTIGNGGADVNLSTVNGGINLTRQ
jgi:DUF4097 and DUF4098 domain-containing protein YvlB